VHNVTSNPKVLRVTRDAAGWTVQGDRYPRSFVEKSRAIERAVGLAQAQRPCQLVILNEDGAVEAEQSYA
jgi:hypothetical protein